jgi:hypothetical protein
LKDKLVDKSIVDNKRDFEGEIEGKKKLKEMCIRVVDFTENADSIETLRSGLQVRVVYTILMMIFSLKCRGLMLPSP